MSDPTQRNGNWAKVLGRAQSDADFRQRLVSQPQAVLQENGVDVPTGVEIKVLENGPVLHHFVLPAKPVQHDSLKRVAEPVGEDDIGGKRWAQVVDKAWADTAFKERLLKDPRAAVAELGMQIPNHLDIRVVEELPKIAYLILPAAQSNELSEQDLEHVAGGGLPGEIAAGIATAGASWMYQHPDQMEKADHTVAHALDPTNW